MEESNSEDERRSSSWETYKILTKIKENVQQKRKVAKDVFVSVVLFDLNEFSLKYFRID